MGPRQWLASTGEALSPALKKNKNSNSKTGLRGKLAASSDSPSGIRQHYEESRGEESPSLPHGPRSRTNSRDISRSYSGTFGDGNDMLPFECQRVQNSEIFHVDPVVFVVSYATVLTLIELVCNYISPGGISLTWTHAIHSICSLIYVHWLKGNLIDTQNEMGALTLWEQFVALGPDAAFVRQTLLIVPVLLCYAACDFADYSPPACLMNFILLAIEIVGKTDFMNGVRIFGINRTVGIDDSIHDKDDENADTTPSRKKNN